jgi:hypothetical protein
MSLYLHLLVLTLLFHHLFTLIPHPLFSIIHLFNLILHPTLPFSTLHHSHLLPLHILPYLLHPNPNPNPNPHPNPHSNPFPKPPLPTKRKIMPRICRLPPMHNNTIQLIHLIFNLNQTFLQVNCIMFLHVLILLNVIAESFQGQNQVIGVLADEMLFYGLNIIKRNITFYDLLLQLSQVRF